MTDPVVAFGTKPGGKPVMECGGMKPLSSLAQMALSSTHKPNAQVQPQKRDLFGKKTLTWKRYVRTIKISQGSALIAWVKHHRRRNGEK
ncbi:hypothetical protein Btru_038876 [Bulinus truncatus]|nr:hypothetical protein Btru_038876 [Bulinus truncatus]